MFRPSIWYDCHFAQRSTERTRNLMFAKKCQINTVILSYLTLVLLRPMQWTASCKCTFYHCLCISRSESIVTLVFRIHIFDCGILSQKAGFLNSDIHEFHQFFLKGTYIDFSKVGLPHATKYGSTKNYEKLRLFRFNATNETNQGKTFQNYGYSCLWTKILVSGAYLLWP